jgi:hypothetical protein
MRLQVSGVSADDANFLLAGKKIFRHHMSSIAACSKYNVHSLLLVQDRMREVGLKLLMWGGG